MKSDMKIRYIKVDSSHYLIDNISGEKVHKFDPDNHNIDFVMIDDDSTLRVDNSNISYKYDNIIQFVYNNELYIIDDGYRNILIKAGYLVYQDYDKRQEKDKEQGYARRNSIAEMIAEALKHFSKAKVIRKVDNNITIQFEQAGFKFTIDFDTIGNIVNENQDRKTNNINFMPFNKKMDKYYCFYIAVFAQRLDKNIKDGREKYTIANRFIKDFINEINKNIYHYEYHYDSLQIKYRVPRV